MRAEGVSEEKALSQIELFKKGPVYTRLERACSVNDGIARLAPAEIDALAPLFTQAAAQGRALQFTPASGAATRMFKGLLATLARADKPAFAALAKEAGGGNADSKEFLDFWLGLPLLPFRDSLRESLGRAGLSLDALHDAKDWRPVVEHLILAKTSTGA